MAHYAFIDEKNIVTEVIVGKDEDELIDGKDPETWYGEFRGEVCKQTSYNTRAGVHYAPNSDEPDDGVALRKNYAGIGFSYDADRDAFIPPKTFPSWVLDESTCTWETPIPRPDNERVYDWNEETQSWDLRLPEEFFDDPIIP